MVSYVSVFQKDVDTDDEIVKGMMTNVQIFADVKEAIMAQLNVKQQIANIFFRNGLVIEVYYSKSSIGIDDVYYKVLHNAKGIYIKPEKLQGSDVVMIYKTIWWFIPKWGRESEMDTASFIIVPLPSDHSLEYNGGSVPAVSAIKQTVLNAISLAVGAQDAAVAMLMKPLKLGLNLLGKVFVAAMNKLMEDDSPFGDAEGIRGFLTLIGIFLMQSAFMVFCWRFLLNKKCLQ